MPVFTPFVGTESARSAGRGGEEGGEGQFGGADEGGVVAQGGGTQLDVFAGHRQDVAGDAGPDLFGRPGIQVAQHPAEHHHPGVEQVDQVGHPDAQPVTDPAQRLTGARISPVGVVGHRPDRRTAEQLGGPPGGVEQGPLADLGLQAAGRATTTGPSVVRVDDHVPDFAAVAAVPAQQPTADDDPRPVSAGDSSSTRPSRASSVVSARMVLRLSPIRVASSAREIAPRRWTWRSSVPALRRRISSGTTRSSGISVDAACPTGGSVVTTRRDVKVCGGGQRLAPARRLL